VKVHHFPTVGEPIKPKNSLGPFAVGRKSTECRRTLRVVVDDPMPFFEARPDSPSIRFLASGNSHPRDVRHP
jgi:hypothetical protein